MESQSLAPHRCQRAMRFDDAPRSVGHSAVVGQPRLAEGMRKTPRATCDERAGTEDAKAPRVTTKAHSAGFRKIGNLSREATVGTRVNAHRRELYFWRCGTGIAFALAGLLALRGGA